MLSIEQIRQLIRDSNAGLKEAKKQMKKAPKNSVQWSINRDLALINKAESEILLKVLYGNDSN